MDGYEQATLARATEYAEQLGRAEAIIESLVLALSSTQSEAQHQIAIESAKRWLNDQAVRRERVEALRAEREGR